MLKPARHGGNRPSLSRSPAVAHGSALVVILLWSGTYIFTKMALKQMGPMSLAFYRNAVASIALLLCFLAMKPALLLPRPADFPALAGLGICGIGFFYMLQNIGLRYTTATDTALLVTASPAMITALAVFVLGERCTRRNLLGIVLASAGVISLALFGSGVSHGGVLASERAFGDVLITLTALGWAIYTVYSKGMMLRYSTLALTMYTTVLGTLALAPFALVEARGNPGAGLSPSILGSILYLGILGSAVGYLLWNHALRHLTAGTVGAYLYVRPVFTAVLAALVLGEHSTAITLVCGLLIAIGAGLCLFKQRE